MAEDAAALEIAAVDTMAGDAAALEIAAIAAMASEAPSAPVDRRTSEMTIAPDRVVRGTSLDAEADDMGRNVSHANTALPLVATAAVDHEAIAAPEAAALNPRSRSASTPKRIAGLDAAKPKSAPARCARCDDRGRRQAPPRTQLLQTRSRAPLASLRGAHSGLWIRTPPRTTTRALPPSTYVRAVVALRGLENCARTASGARSAVHHRLHRPRYVRRFSVLRRERAAPGEKS